MGRGKMGMQKRTWIDFLFLSFLMSFVWLNGYEVSVTGMIRFKYSL